MRFSVHRRGPYNASVLRWWSRRSATLWIVIGAAQVGESLTQQTSMAWRDRGLRWANVNLTQVGSVAGYAGMGYAARDLAR
jgi:hypothetical protein